MELLREIAERRKRGKAVLDIQVYNPRELNSSEIALEDGGTKTSIERSDLGVKETVKLQIVTCEESGKGGAFAHRWNWIRKKTLRKFKSKEKKGLGR